jgi:hypothetical protein
VKEKGKKGKKDKTKNKTEDGDGTAGASPTNIITFLVLITLQLLRRVSQSLLLWTLHLGQMRRMTQGMPKKVKAPNYCQRKRRSV